MNHLKDAFLKVLDIIFHFKESFVPMIVIWVLMVTICYSRSFFPSNFITNDVLKFSSTITSQISHERSYGCSTLSFSWKSSWCRSKRVRTFTSKVWLERHSSFIAAHISIEISWSPRQIFLIMVVPCRFTMLKKVVEASWKLEWVWPMSVLTRSYGGRQLYLQNVQ